MVFLLIIGGLQIGWAVLLWWLWEDGERHFNRVTEWEMQCAKSTREIEAMKRWNEENPTRVYGRLYYND